jgi:hypothetical protein
MAVARVGTPAAPVNQVGSNTPSITTAWGTGQNRTAGNVLYCWAVAWGGTTAGAIAPPSGWVTAVDAGAVTNAVQARAILFRKIAAGADAAPVLTATNTGTATNARLGAGLEEFSGADPVTPEGASGTVTASAGTTLTMATSGNVPQAGCYAFTACQISSSTAAAETWTPGSGFTNAYTDGALAQRSHAAQDVNGSPASGSPASNAGSTTLTIQVGIGLIVVIQPPVPGGILPQQMSGRRRAAPVMVPAPAFYGR